MLGEIASNKSSNVSNRKTPIFAHQKEVERQGEWRETQKRKVKTLWVKLIMAKIAPVMPYNEICIANLGNATSAKSTVYRNIKKYLNGKREEESDDRSC